MMFSFASSRHGSAAQLSPEGSRAACCGLNFTWWNSLGLQRGTQAVPKTYESCGLLFSMLSCVLRNSKYIVVSGT